MLFNYRIFLVWFSGFFVCLFLMAAICQTSHFVHATVFLSSLFSYSFSQLPSEDYSDFFDNL